MTRNILTDALGEEAPKKRPNNKKKGNVNERRACRWLESWTGLPKDSFNRTPASGGLRWLDSSRIAGDVVAPSDFDFPFAVEVKSRVELHVTKTLRVNSEVLTFWKQAKRDAERVGKEPLLMMRKNNMRETAWLVALEPELAAAILDAYPDAAALVGNSPTVSVLASEYLLSVGYQPVKDLLLGVLKQQKAHENSDR